MYEQKLTATFTAYEQHDQDGKIIYWFALNGVHEKTGTGFENDVYGIAEVGGESYVVYDCGLVRVADGSWEDMAVRQTAIVTDEMRAFAKNSRGGGK